MVKNNVKLGVNVRVYKKYIKLYIKNININNE